MSAQSNTCTVNTREINRWFYRRADSYVIRSLRPISGSSPRRELEQCFPSRCIISPRQVGVFRGFNIPIFISLPSLYLSFFLYQIKFFFIHFLLLWNQITHLSTISWEKKLQVCHIFAKHLKCFFYNFPKSFLFFLFPGAK